MDGCCNLLERSQITAATSTRAGQGLPRNPGSRARSPETRTRKLQNQHKVIRIEWASLSKRIPAKKENLRQKKPQRSSTPDRNSTLAVHREQQRNKHYWSEFISMYVKAHLDLSLKALVVCCCFLVGASGSLAGVPVLVVCVGCFGCLCYTIYAQSGLPWRRCGW